MKRTLLLSIIFFLVACKSKNPVGPNGVMYKDALEYSNYIINRQQDIMKDIMDYSDAAKTGMDAADRKLDKMVEDVSARLKDIQGMPAFHGDSAFRDAAIKLFAFYKQTFNVDYREIHALRRKYDAGTISEEERTRMVAVSTHVAEAEKPLDEKLQETQTKFAKDNNFTLIPNTVQKDMEDKLK